MRLVCVRVLLVERHFITQSLTSFYIMGVLITVLLAIVAALLILIVLVQNPKGGGLNTAFGGAASASQLLGASRSTDLVEKITWGLASAMLVLCLVASLTFKGQQAGGDDTPTVDLTEQPTE